MGETIKTTVKLSRSLWKDLRKRCIDLDLDTADGLDAAIEVWLKETEAAENGNSKPAGNKRHSK